MKKLIFFVLLIFTFLLFFQLYRVAKNYSQSYRFGDEDAHMLAGHLVLKGYRPYEDFSGNHQPFAYYFTAATEKIAPANSLFLFVGRNRLAIFFYSIMWQIIFLIFFGWPLLFFSLIFEVSKYVLLGNKVLGEVLAMYPLVYLFGTVIKATLISKKLTAKELIMFSLATFLTVFSLFPLWPSVFVLNLYLFFIYRKNRKNLFLLFAPVLTLTIILFSFISFKDYFQNTIIDNVSYVIPKMNNNKYTSIDYLKTILLPVSALYSKPNFINVTVLLFLFIYMSLIYIFYKLKKLQIFMVISLALLLANNRNMTIKFGDFHVLPWLAAFISVPIISLSFVNQIKKNKSLARLAIVTAFFLVLLSLWIATKKHSDFHGNLLFNLKNDISTEHYINYSRSVKYGLGIKSVKSDGDRVFGLGNDTLAIWVADADLAVPPLESMRWQYEMLRHRSKLLTIFSQNPPEFFIMDNADPLSEHEPIGKLIVDSLRKDYIQINHLEKPSELFITKQKINTITEKQWQTFKYYLFDKPLISSSH